MEKKNKNSIWLILLLFAVSISTTLIPTQTINTYGLLGEVRTSTVTEQQVSVEKVAYRLEENSCIKGVNLYNLWFELQVLIICLVYSLYKNRLPREETIVSLKVRLDD